jgi:hypothetical protein
MNWTDLVQDSGQCRALVKTVMNLRVSYIFYKFLGSCTTGSFSRRAQLHGVSHFPKISTTGAGGSYVGNTGTKPGRHRLH